MGSGLAITHFTQHVVGYSKVVHISKQEYELSYDNFCQHSYIVLLFLKNTIYSAKYVITRPDPVLPLRLHLGRFDGSEGAAVGPHHGPGSGRQAQYLEPGA